MHDMPYGRAVHLCLDTMQNCTRSARYTKKDVLSQVLAACLECARYMRDAYDHTPYDLHLSVIDSARDVSKPFSLAWRYTSILALASATIVCYRGQAAIDWSRYQRHADKTLRSVSLQ